MFSQSHAVHSTEVIIELCSGWNLLFVFKFSREWLFPCYIFHNMCCYHSKRKVVATFTHLLLQMEIPSLWDQEVISSCSFGLTPQTFIFTNANILSESFVHEAFLNLNPKSISFSFYPHNESSWYCMSFSTI